MASAAEVDARSADNRDRLNTLEATVIALIENTIVLGEPMIKVDAVDGEGANISKAGRYVYGKKAGINDGNLIVGWKVKAGVDNPSSNADFETPNGLGQ